MPGCCQVNSIAKRVLHQTPPVCNRLHGRNWLFTHQVLAERSETWKKCNANRKQRMFSCIVKVMHCNQRVSKGVTFHFPRFNYCSANSWWASADKLASSMQATAWLTKPITRRISVSPSDCQQPLPHRSGNAYFSILACDCQGITPKSLGLCDWGKSSKNTKQHAETSCSQEASQRKLMVSAGGHWHTS